MDTNAHIRRARAGLTQVIEPADHWGARFTAVWGPIRTFEVIAGANPTDKEWATLDLVATGSGSSQKPAAARQALDRWRTRSRYLDPDTALETIDSLGGTFLIPEDELWPESVKDLGSDAEPLGLWLRGAAHPRCLSAPLVAMVGSREITHYGTTATQFFARHLRNRQLTIVSGGAFGVDAVAHRTALEHVVSTGNDETGTVPTIAVLAGGLDQFYPSANSSLFEQIIETGLLVSEFPPGIRPNRFRFLNRNRVIAALAGVVLVTEAQWRSGAQNTAHHAFDLGRPVGAVPGPFNSPASAGCHRLLTDTPAQIVFDEQSLIELLPEALLNTQRELPIDVSNRTPQRTAQDQLTVEQQLIYDALPLRTYRAVDEICAMTGLAVPVAVAALGNLVAKGHAEEHNRQYRALRRR